MNHLTISRTANRALTILSSSSRSDDVDEFVRESTRTLRSERFTYDSAELTDSAALHQVLTIRDPGETYSVRFLPVLIP